MTSLSASGIAGHRIRQARTERGWTVRELAGRCAKAGAPQITHTVVTNLETRRRSTREITVDELLVMALALEVPPMQLMLPLGEGERLEVTPGTEMDALEAVAWIGGEAIPLHDRELFSSMAGETAHLIRHLDHGGVLNMIRLAGRAIRLITHEDEMLARSPGSGEAGVQRLRLLADRLMHIAARMEALGYDPPALGRVREILKRRGLPATLGEWRKRAQDDDPYGDDDGGPGES